MKPQRSKPSLRAAILRDPSSLFSALAFTIMLGCITPLSTASANDRLPARGEAPQATDPRLREQAYDPHAVVTVPVRRGVVTMVLLAPDEAITEVAAGLGGDCAKPEETWCVHAQAGGRTLFVKPKRAAYAANNLAVVTNQRTHAFRFEVLPNGDPRPSVLRLTIKAPVTDTPSTPRPSMNDEAWLAGLDDLAQATSPQQMVKQRLQVKPQVRNARYAIAEGKASQDIVPTLIFDDGRFTYLRFPGNRSIPAVFQVEGDGSESLVNTRMEDDLLVVDRVSRRLMLRVGQAVVGVWNEGFDLNGVPPTQGTAVPGVARVLKSPEIDDASVPSE